ncbi:MAG: DNA adenine methylase, partial [Candidatus Omnitrophica bacterium]|nr:DNA adenine methylase [Candidatus Omnitrophota bacterium]
WSEALRDSSNLAETVQDEFFPITSVRFRELQKECQSILDPHQKAAIFFALNRASFSGTGLSGGCPKKMERFTPSSIDFLRTFQCQNLSVDLADFHQSLDLHQDEFAYLDPPYIGPQSGLYGQSGNCHDGFDHHGLAEILRDRDNWVLSYDDHSLVQDLYQGHLCVRPTWRYGMNSSKDSNELLIFSGDLNDWARCVASDRGEVIERI